MLQVYLLEYASTYNVKAIKGFAMKMMTDAQRKKTNPKNLKATFKDELLRDTDKLLTLKCGKTPVIVVGSNHLEM